MNTDISPEILRVLYKTMVLTRRFEEKIGELVQQKEIKCPVHLYIGQEAVATGVCANLGKADWVFSNHRSHGHYIAKGGSLKAMTAECYGKSTGCSRGRGGSMHLADPEMGLPGSPAILGGTLSIAVGAGLAFARQHNNNVSVVFFGDGAVNEGVFYECLNFASLQKLPVIFVCENNLYATHMPVAATLADTRIYKKAEAFNMPGLRSDGNNVIEVFQTAGKIIEHARKGKGPALIEFMTYRWRGHVGPNIDVGQWLRSQEEFDSWMERCPIKALEKLLFEQRILTEPSKKKIIKEIDAEIEDAISFARESPYPAKKELLDNVFKA